MLCERTVFWDARQEDDQAKQGASIVSEHGQLPGNTYACPCAVRERYRERKRGSGRDDPRLCGLGSRSTQRDGEGRGNNCGNISIPTAVDPNQDTNHSSSVKALIASYRHRYRVPNTDSGLTVTSLKLWLQLRLRLRLWLFASRNSLEFFFAFVVMLLVLLFFFFAWFWFGFFEFFLCLGEKS